MDDNFPDRIFDQARATAQRKRNGQRAHEAPKASPRQPKRQKEIFTALVLEDKLYYYFATPSNEYRPSRPIASPSSEAKDAEKVFVSAFIDAWHHVPQPDRQKLKDYWQRPHWQRLNGERFPCEIVPSHHPRPLIQILDDWWDGRMDPDYNDFGDVMKFSVSAILQNESGLCSEIIKTLANVYWGSTIASAELLTKTIFDPMDAWRKTHRDCSDAAFRKKDAALCKKYEKAYFAEIAKILHRWEVGAASKN